jgi:hypothetical protein
MFGSPTIGSERARGFKNVSVTPVALDSLVSAPTETIGG